MLFNPLPLAWRAIKRYCLAWALREIKPLHPDLPRLVLKKHEPDHPIATSRTLHV